MSQRIETTSSPAGVWVWLFPLAYGLHIAEEHWFHFPAWVSGLARSFVLLDVPGELVGPTRAWSGHTRRLAGRGGHARLVLWSAGTAGREREAEASHRKSYSPHHWVPPVIHPCLTLGWMRLGSP